MNDCPADLLRAPYTEVYRETTERGQCGWIDCETGNFSRPILRPSPPLACRSTAAPVEVGQRCRSALHCRRRPVMERPETVCISGSMRFYPLMLRVAEQETANGHIVLMPFVTVHDDQQDGEHKRMLDELHFAKIRMSDRVIVVSDETGYYGESTSREIRYAGELGLPVEHRPVSAPVPADDEAAVERMARALHRGAWERDIANGTPLEDNDVDSCWSKVGAKYREWYYADARAALAALRGE